MSPSDANPAATSAREPTDLWALSATDALAAFRTRELSPVEYQAALFARVDAHEPAINAVVERLADALDHARAAEAAYLRDDIDEVLLTRPLLGLPIAAKEKHAIAGRELTQGLISDKGTIAAEDSVVIARIRAAGGHIGIRTTTPEYSCATFTHSPMWGVTRNPWNPEYSPGGSSGGSGAALAAGYAPLATGSDIGGSTRLPAAFNGVVGFKAPYGRVPGAPPLSADWYRGDGPLARTVADTALLARVLAGIHPSDHATVPSAGFLDGFDPTTAAEALAGTRIALSVTLGDFPVEPDVERNTRALAEVLAAAGAIVEEVELPWRVDEMMTTAFTHYGSILAPMMAAATRGVEDTLAPYTRRFMEKALSVAGSRSLAEGLAEEARHQSQLAEAMAGFDVLLTPTSAVAGLRADGDYLDGITAHTAGGDRDLDFYWQGHMAIPFNIANRVPVVNVPSGMADCGIPSGVQIVGHPYADRSAFDVAAAVERLAPWTGLAPLG